MLSVLAALWLPVLVSAVFVFIASSIIHMASPWHKNDYPRVPNQDAVMDAIRPLAIPPGDYLIPRAANRDEMKSPEFAEKINRGPVLLMTVMPNGPWTMGGTFVKWFLYLILVSAIAGHVAQGALHADSDGIRVFHTVALTAFGAYALALWQLSIWYRRKWSLTLKATVDALVYAAITGATFMWLWSK